MITAPAIKELRILGKKQPKTPETKNLHNSNVNRNVFVVAPCSLGNRVARKRYLIRCIHLANIYLFKVNSRKGVKYVQS